MKRTTDEQLNRLYEYKSELLTVSEVADVLGVSENQVRYLARKGKITKAKRGYYERFSLESFILLKGVENNPFVSAPKRCALYWDVDGTVIKDKHFTTPDIWSDNTFFGKQRGKIFKERLLEFVYLIETITRDCERGILQEYYEYGGVGAWYAESKSEFDGEIVRLYSFEIIRRRREQITKVRKKQNLKRGAGRKPKQIYAR